MMWRASLQAGADRFTLYLPLLLLAVLSLGSWWFVRAIPSADAPRLPEGLRTEPDYKLAQFSTQVFDARGQSIRRIAGHHALHYPASAELHVQSLAYQATPAQGGRVVAQADRAVVGQGGKRVTLMGQVVLERSGPASAAMPQMPALQVRGERLVMAQQPDRIWSDAPMEVRRGQDRFTSQGLQFDLTTGQYQFLGRAQAVLQPPVRP